MTDNKWAYILHQELLSYYRKLLQGVEKEDINLMLHIVAIYNINSYCDQHSQTDMARKNLIKEAISRFKESSIP